MAATAEGSESTYGLAPEREGTKAWVIYDKQAGLGGRLFGGATANRDGTVTYNCANAIARPTAPGVRCWRLAAARRSSAGASRRIDGPAGGNDIYRDSYHFAGAFMTGSAATATR